MRPVGVRGLYTPGGTMAPLPALHIKALDDLAAQLRFAPASAARRQMERAEELLGTISPGQTYPEDWIVFAITGYRPEMASPTLVVGSALLGDLVSLVERLGVAAGLTEGDLPGLGDAEPGWLDAEQVCERWGISRKTLDRHRRASVAAGDGVVLPARRVRMAEGREKLYFAIGAVRAFEARRGEALAGARGFSRIDAETERKVVRLAGKYHERLGWSLNQAAKRLAERYGRGHETIRQVLRRAEGETPMFREAGPLTERQRRVVARAYARGVPVERLAARFERTRASMYRVLVRERADFLRSLVLVEGESAEVPAGAAARVLGSAGVVGGLGRAAPGTLAELLAYVEAEPVPDPRAEKDRATAYWVLRGRASEVIAAMPLHQVGAGACDEAETLLRWASRLKAELVRSQLGLIPKQVRAATGRELTNFPRAAVGGLMEECVGAIIEAVEQFDPTKGGRLAAPVGMALTRTMARWVKSHGTGLAPGKAQPSTDPAALALGDWTARVDLWQARLEPDRRVRQVVDGLGAAHQSFLRERFGWASGDRGAGPPRTIAAMAPERGLTLHHTTALERESIVAAVRAYREAHRG